MSNNIDKVRNKSENQKNADDKDVDGKVRNNRVKIKG